MTNYKYQRILGFLQVIVEALHVFCVPCRIRVCVDAKRAVQQAENFRLDFVELLCRRENPVYCYIRVIMQFPIVVVAMLYL